MTGWDEIGAEVFARRYEPWDLTVGVVRSDDGLLVVDTRASPRQADELRRDLAQLGRPVRWVVNTHAHFDHTFGNQRFAADGVPIHGHHRLPRHLARREATLLADRIERLELGRDARRDPDLPVRPDESLEEWREVVVTPPSVPVDDHAVLDLGSRQVELVHLGRGHTDHDLLVHVPDAEVWFAGDLVEQSGPPMYGPGSFPLDWPTTVGALHARLGPGSVVVPGHGEVVDVDFVAVQQRALGVVADTIRELHESGVPGEHAVAMGVDAWPFPIEGMAAAVADGYSQLALEQ